MKQILTVMMHVLGVVAVAVFFFAMMAAPGFLSAASSVIRLDTVTEISSR